jgi:hypothetical protein
MMPTMNDTYVNCSEYQVEMEVPGLEDVKLSYVVQYHSVDDTNMTYYYDMMSNDTMSNETDYYYGTMSVRVEYSGQGWVGFAVSPDGGMTGSDGVIGLPTEYGNGTVSKFALGYGLVEQLEEEEQTLVYGSIMQDESVTVLEFTRYLDEGYVPIDGSGVNYFLVAYGYSNTLGYHAARVSFSLTLSPCITTSTTTMMTTTTMEDDPDAMMEDVVDEDTMMTEEIYTSILRSNPAKKEEKVTQKSEAQALQETTSGAAESISLLGVGSLVSMVAAYGLM